MKYTPKGSSEDSSILAGATVFPDAEVIPRAKPRRIVRIRTKSRRAAEGSAAMLL